MNKKNSKFFYKNLSSKEKLNRNILMGILFIPAFILYVMIDGFTMDKIIPLVVFPLLFLVFIRGNYKNMKKEAIEYSKEQAKKSKSKHRIQGKDGTFRDEDSYENDPH